MKETSKFPNNFFNKQRPEAPKKKTDIKPINWSTEVANGEKIAFIKSFNKSTKVR